MAIVITFFISNEVIQAFLTEYIDIKLKLKDIIDITKAYILLSNKVLTKIFSSINLNQQIVGKALLIIKIL